MDYDADTRAANRDVRYLRANRWFWVGMYSVVLGSMGLTSFVASDLPSRWGAVVTMALILLVLLYVYVGTRFLSYLSTGSSKLERGFRFPK